MNLEELRDQIDKIDDQIIELLAKRLRVVVKIGDLKESKGIEVRDDSRYQALLDKLLAKAAASDVPEELVKAIYHEIHEAAIAKQQKSIK